MRQSVRAQRQALPLRREPLRVRQCQTTNLPPRVIGALQASVWRSHIHFRTGNGGPSCYRWRKSGNGFRTSMRPATRPLVQPIERERPAMQQQQQIQPTTRRNRRPAVGGLVGSVLGSVLIPSVLSPNLKSTVFVFGTLPDRLFRSWC
jgi:hypothetical protein